MIVLTRVLAIVGGIAIVGGTFLVIMFIRQILRDGWNR